MQSHALVTKRVDRIELEALVTPGVSVNVSYVFVASSVKMPRVASVVVLYLSLTADTVLCVMWFSKDDLPALGAPKRHDRSRRAPIGESVQSISS